MMKTIRKNLGSLAIIGGLIGSLNLIQAAGTINPVQTVSAEDTAGMLQAVEATTPLPAALVPPYGTFYSALHANWAPLPANVNSVPAWNLGDGVWLLDDLDQPQAQMRTMAGNLMAVDVPSPGDGGNAGGSNNSCIFTSSYTIDTNRLFLEITGVSNGVASFNLHNASNQVYAITSKSNLLSADWKIEQEVWPNTNQTVTPFTVPVLGRTSMLFIRAQDWTGVTENGNTTPDWWFWEYFGTTALSDTNLDSQGNTLLYDYQFGLDPNVIQFSVSVTNDYIRSSYAQVCLSVTAGAPSYYAVMLDSTNFTQLVWNPYVSSNITVNLGLTGGWHSIWIGLKGLPPDATQTWQWLRLNLAWPPMLAITNPISSIVSVPVIQIYGYCQDTLASLCYDLSNATGLAINQPAEVTGRDYDTNGNTTSFFECLDVPLTNGLNTLTLHATNLAGNVTITNFSFTLDYSAKTNPPLVQITWPQEGAQLSGTNFTVTGWVADPTVTITTQLVLTNGSGTNAYVYTNSYAGEIDRNGNFWLENLPLAPGTNAFAIAVVDAVGNTSLTNLSVVQSPLVLTINPVADSSQLWQPTVNVTGTISAPTYAVWVNGVKGTNYGNGSWAAFNVPPGTGGTATFTATAYAPAEQQPDGSHGN